MFQKITPSLYVGQSRLYGMNCGVFVSQNQACLIDPCLFPDEIQAMQQLINEKQIEVQSLILTHSHWDHLFGPQYFPAVETIAHALYVHEIEEDGAHIYERVVQWQTENQVAFERPFELPQPDKLVGHDEWIKVADLDLNILHAPGHAADQIIVYQPESKTLWAADLLSDIEIPFIFDSLTAYERTIKMLADLEILTLIPGHGSPTQDTEEIANRFMEDRFYLTEIHGRVEEAIKRGDSAEQAVVDCGSMRFKRPEENRAPHERNVRFVYKELLASS